MQLAKESLGGDAYHGRDGDGIRLGDGGLKADFEPGRSAILVLAVYLLFYTAILVWAV